MDATNIYNIVWDMTIGAGVMPESWTAKHEEHVAGRLGREEGLTPDEKYTAKQAWQRCYQKFHQP